MRAVDAAGNLSANSAGVSATPSAATKSEVLTGAFKRGSVSVVYTRTAQPGALRGVAGGTAKGRPASVTLTLKDAQGTVLGAKSGTSIDVQATAAAAGAYSWTISGTSGVSYSLTISYSA